MVETLNPKGLEKAIQTYASEHLLPHRDNVDVWDWEATKATVSNIVTAYLAALSPTPASETSDLAEENKRLRRQAGEWMSGFADAKLENARLREALEKIERAPAWGAPDRWETTPAEVRQLARAALRASKGTESHG